MNAKTGSRRRDSRNQPSRRRLYRDVDHGMLAGVCAGIADYFGIKVLFVRLVTVILALPFFVTVVLIYLGLAFFLDRRPEDLYRDSGEERFWRSVRLEPSRTTSDLVHKFADLERRLRAAEASVTSREFRLKQAFRDLEA